MIQVSIEELQRARRVMFGDDCGAVPATGIALHPRDLSRRFHRRALETHPDRARQLGVAAEVLRVRFEELVWAYRTLRTSGVAGSRSERPDPVRQTPPTQRPEPPRSERDAPSASLFYRGPLPRRPLLIGQFAYFSGLVPWHALVAAISWQRRQRPLIGALAVELGILDRRQVGRLLRQRLNETSSTMRFAEFARSKGALNHFQQLAVVGHQRRMQRPIGQFFVDRQLLEPATLDELAMELRRHNWRHGRRV